MAFVADDTVWCAPLDGGVAVRCFGGAAGDGVVSFPRLSPDATQVAFTRQDAAGFEVHVAPVGGGPSRQLTWLGANSLARGWLADGRVLFTSDTGQPFRQTMALHAVPAGGGPVEALPLGPAREAAWGDDGTVVLGRNTNDPARWKRNRGGSIGKLWVDRGGKGTYRPMLRDLDGDIASPMVLGRRLWFLSDHEGTGNLYSSRTTGADVTRHTDFDGFYARWATTDGERIAFQRAGALWLFDPATDATTAIEVEVPAARRAGKRRRVKAAQTFAPTRPAEGGFGLPYAIDDAGEQVAMEARGRVAAFGAFAGATRVLAPSGTRQRLPRFLPDGSVLLVTEDDAGQHLEVHASGGGVRRLPARVDGRVGDIAPSPDGTRAAVVTHRGELLLVDICGDETDTAGKTVTPIDQSEHGSVASPAWSPDGRWLAYSRAASGDFIRQIRLLDVTTSEVHDVTRPEFGDGRPSFDPTGRYLYFVSARAFEPSVDVMGFELHFARPTMPYVLTLDATEPSPFRDATPGGAAEAAGGRVDVTGLGQRIRAVPVQAGRYGQLIAVADGLVLRSDPIAGSTDFTLVPTEVPARSELQHVALGEGKLTTLAEGVTDVTATTDRRALLVRHGRNLRRIAVGAGTAAPEAAPPTEQKRSTGWVALDRVSIDVNAPAEWRQLFDEAWRLMAEFYWTPDMGGVDWPAVRAQYEPLLDRVACRADLSDLIWDMYGELGVGHAYEFGGDYDLPAGERPGQLGADTTWDGKGWRIDRILVGDPWDAARSSPLVGPGLDVRAGDRIVAVDGEPAAAATPLAAQLAGRAGQDVQITLVRGRGRRHDVLVRPLADDRPARYREWVGTNRATVHAATDGRVGYIHVPNMGAPGFGEFHRSFYAEFNRDALIVDVRFNEGGFVSTLLLEKLLRRRLGVTVYRWRRTESYPRQSVSGVIVGLCNEHTGSDGDLFSHAFRNLELGPLVGVPTWGGVIGIHTKEPGADGTVTAQPELAHWFPDVGYGIEGGGAQPTHHVDVHPDDDAAGRDRQLDEALRLVTRALKRAAPAWDHATHPDRRRPPLPPR